MQEHIKYLNSLGACDEAVAYAKNYATLQEAWDSCERADWMLWLQGRISGGRESDSRKKLVLAACAVARSALKYVRDGKNRPLLAIETAERWANGTIYVTSSDVQNAAAAAYHAATDAADSAAIDAAYAAAHAAYAAADSAAIDAAIHATDAAAASAYAATDATDSAAIDATAYGLSMRESANIVRAFYPLVKVSYTGTSHASN